MDTNLILEHFEKFKVILALTLGLGVFVHEEYYLFRKSPISGARFYSLTLWNFLVGTVFSLVIYITVGLTKVAILWIDRLLKDLMPGNQKH